MRIWKVASALVALLAPAQADDVATVLDVLVAAYPDHLAGHDGKDVIWKDGTRMPASDGRTQKSFDELLDAPSLVDQFAIPYPLGTDLRRPARDEDPGRIRNEAFFRKMYGDCRRGEISPRLKAVPWTAKNRGNTVMATSVNGVADRLAAVARDLDALPDATTKYLAPSAGGYNCRPIAGTQRLSVHAYGAAIDLNAAFGDYWLWAKNPAGQSGDIVWKNRIPLAIVDVFERHGFIWGGKWYHFDTFHFEYRPDIVALAKRGWPSQTTRSLPNAK